MHSCCSLQLNYNKRFFRYNYQTKPIEHAKLLSVATVEGPLPHDNRRCLLRDGLSTQASNGQGQT